MVNITKVTVIVLLVFIEFAHSQLSRNKEELLNWCLKSKNHKPKPGKEDALHKQCTPWKDYACCTTDTTADIHEINMYNFTFDHCHEETGVNMSSACRKHFTQDNCFYECEPHIGVWVVETKRKIASERFHKVPLCASDCDEWFEDCKKDYTCAYNWPRDFKFNKGHNTCNGEQKCITFEKMYKTAKDFCENVWDESWQYTPDSEPCVHMWFDGPENPNKKVAEYYVDKYLNSGSGLLKWPWMLVVVALTFLWS